MRLERIMWRARGFVRGAREKHLLIRGWDVHVQSLLGDRLQTRSARRVTDIRLQPDAIRLERVALLLELSNLPLLLDTEDPPCNDARRDQDETDEHHGDEAAPTRLYSALRHARSRALRARGLQATSSADAGIARRVMVVPSGRPRQVQTGCLGGQMQAALHSRNAFFTMRSSPE